MTATGSALRAGDTNNKVATWALNLKAVAEEALASLAYFNKIADPDFVVEIDTEYGVFSDAAEINTLLQACTMGVLSKTDFLLEMQRRGALRSDFSIAANADRLSTEFILGQARFLTSGLRGKDVSFDQHYRYRFHLDSSGNSQANQEIYGPIRAFFASTSFHPGIH